MKKSLISLLVAAFAFTPFFGMIPTAKAASMNTAIRGQSSFTVYWYANDGKRYPFPNAATYFSWFNSFDNVQEVSDFELQNITLANENVTYRPGAKLVKIQTSSRVYAVARNGVLRHVTSESVARDLYGSDWSLKVHDIPDVFFSNYTVGSPIYSASDYNVSNEYNGVVWPHQSLKNGSNTNQNNNDSLNFNANRTSINSGDAVVLTVNYNGASNSRIEIKNVRNSSLVKTCYNTSYCSVTVYPQESNEGATVQYIATVYGSSGSVATNQYSQVIYIDGNNNGSYSDDAYLSLIDRSHSNSNERVTFGAGVSRSGYSNANTTLRVYDATTGELITSCYEKTYCSFSRTFTDNMTRTWYVRATNANGDTIESNRLTFSVNGNGTQSGSLSLNASRTNITSGQSVNLNAYYNNSPSNGRIEIKEVRSGNLVKTCYGNTSCSVTVYPYQSSYSSTQYYAVAFNSSGSQVATKYGPTIYFDGNVTNTKPSITSPYQDQVFTNYPRTLTVQWSGSARRHQVEVSCGGCWPVVGQNASTVYLTTDNYRNWVNTEITGDDRITLRVRAINDNGTYGTWSDTVNTRFNTSGSNNDDSYQNDGTNYISDVRFEVSDTSIVRGGRVKLTVNAFNVGNWNYNGNRIEIRDIRTGTVVKTCYDQSWCVADVNIYDNYGEGIAQYEARLFDRNGRYVMNELSPVIQFVN